MLPHAVLRGHDDRVFALALTADSEAVLSAS